MKEYVTAHGGIYSKECDEAVKKIANQGGTPLVVARDHIILGVIPSEGYHQSRREGKICRFAENGDTYRYDNR